MQKKLIECDGVAGVSYALYRVPSIVNNQLQSVDALNTVLQM